jgi:hypothetical protein
MNRNRVLSTPAREQIYGSNGNFIAWAGEAPPADGVIGVGQPSPTPGIRAAAAPGIPLGGEAPTPPESDVTRTASALLPSLAQSHHTFARVLTSRLTELRTLRQMWASGGVETLLTYIRESCHESVAVDCLHALASCRARVPRPEDAESSDAEGGSSSSTPLLQLVGGMPRWAWPHHASVAWVGSVAPVLESLLFSVYEDYLAVATAAVGSLQEAVAGLFALAARCSPRDLLGPGGSAEEVGEEEEEEKLSEDERLYRHAAALQAVEVVRLTAPLVSALRHATQYRGRIGKAAAARLERLQELHACVQELVAAAAAGPGE